MNQRKIIGIDARMCGKHFTGIGRLSNEIINRLPKIMKDVDFVIFLNKAVYENFNPKEENIKKVLADEPIYSWREQTYFLKKIKNENVDLMYFLHFNVPFFYNRPFAVIIHDLTLLDFPGKRLNKFWHRFAFYSVFINAIRRSKGIATVSRFTAKEINQRFMINENKIKHIYNGVDKSFFNHKKSKKEAFEESKKKFGIEKPFFLYTGVHREHKNILGLIEAFSKLDLDAQLVITGKSRLYDEEIELMVENLGLEDKIIFPGLVSEKDLKLLLRGAHVYVFPSFSEGFGLPPLESMASETPVASSSSSCMKEIYGNSAEYFDPCDTKDMAEKMEAVFVDKKIRKVLIKRGSHRASQFDWEHTASLNKVFLHAILRKL